MEIPLWHYFNDMLEKASLNDEASLKLIINQNSSPLLLLKAE